MIRVVPDFYPEFHCIASACRHSCCVGWEVDVDPETLARYRQVPGAFGRRLADQIDCQDTPHFRLDSRDKASLGLLGGLTALLLVGLALGETTAVYFPAVRIPPVTPLSFVFYAAYAALLSFPLVVNGWEDIKWARLTSKI